MKKNKIILPSNKKFGFFFFFIFLISSLLSLSYENIFLFGLFLFLGFTFLILSLVKPNKLEYLNLSWMKFGLLLGNFINPLVLGLIYFLIITPMAIIMKFFRRDELKLKIKIKKTYWISRSKNTYDKKISKNQF